MKFTHAMASALFLLTICSNSILAQSPGCNQEEGFSAFDFWLGDWDVFDNNSQAQAGSNSIEKLENGCLIMETWTGAGGSTGKSINYYNPLTAEWRQVWVSAGRYAIDVTGGLMDESMRLTGTIWYYDGQSHDFRGTWTPNPDGSVRQFFEQYDEENQTWTPWFDGRYVRQNPAP